MHRRQFLTSVAAGGALALASLTLRAHETCRTFASPGEARKSPPEKLAYVLGNYTGTGLKKPDYLRPSI